MGFLELPIAYMEKRGQWSRARLWTHALLSVAGALTDWFNARLHVCDSGLPCLLSPFPRPFSCATFRPRALTRAFRVELIIRRGGANGSLYVVEMERIVPDFSQLEG
jgi:hypothetical protein